LPRSTSLQRPEQKGRNSFPSNSTLFPQIGQRDFISLLKYHARGWLQNMIQNVAE
jgi:hypothetical protein